MSTPHNRRRDPGGPTGEMILTAVIAGAVTLGAGSVSLATHLGHQIAATGTEVPANPVTLLLGLATGRLAWPGAPGWWVLGATTALLATLAILGGIALSRTRRTRSRVDRAAASMGRGRDITDLSHTSAAATARRLGVTTSAGVPIGRTVAGGHPLYGSWEDMHLDIWGPRTGKTTSRAVPAILHAPGAVLVTSNKRDIVDATRDVRATTGPIHVFDPQGITREEPSWWWNPLSYVTDEIRAAKLAGHFAAANTGSKTDAHFEDSGQDLLAGCLLAAALHRRPITTVYTWLTRPGDDTPADILRDGGYPLTADQLAGIAGAPDKERGSIYSTARRMASCLTYRHIASWVTDTHHGDRPHFDPAAFLRSGGTLYSLSREGAGSAGPLVMALTAAVVDAAADLAARSPGGRLATPLLGVLDEAANVCRWRELPDLYSHYGSQGIILMTILQSWSQGVEVWGESGMRKLWSAANIKVYGGGVSETAFLHDLAQLIGDHDRLTTSTSHGPGHRTLSRQLHRERILDIDDLAALPKGRAVVIASGSRPTLIATQPWMSGPHADQVRASIAAHDPQARQTLRQADTELADTERAENDRQTP